MARESLEDLRQSVDNLLDVFRTNDLNFTTYPIPAEYTHWIEEQRAVDESCILVDQSYHMEIMEIEGNDALEVLEGLGVNNFDKFRTREPPEAINLVLCNPDGYLIGDVILFHLEENAFTIVGIERINNWVEYHAQHADADVDTEVVYHREGDEDPPDFRFQIQGPNATNVMSQAIDGELPELSFFEMSQIEIDSIETTILGHGMAGSQGFEIFGPYKHHDHIEQSILDAGKEFGIRRMGSRAYKTGKIGSAWVSTPLPAIYESEDLRAYREWLGADSKEAQMSLGGSFESDDITDYYLTPMETGKGHLIDFEHDFIGKAGLKKQASRTQRDLVTLVWDSGDLERVYGSLFVDGPNYRYVELPDTANRRSRSHYDKVLKDGEVIGVSKYPGYLFYERSMLSLAIIDPEYSDPGEEVSFVWGESSGKERVEQHEPTEIAAEVAEAPFVKRGRRSL